MTLSFTFWQFIAPSFGNLQVTRISIWLDFFNTQNNYFFYVCQFFRNVFFHNFRKFNQGIWSMSKVCSIFCFVMGKFHKNGKSITCMLISFNHMQYFSSNLICTSLFKDSNRVNINQEWYFCWSVFSSGFSIFFLNKHYNLTKTIVLQKL